MNITPPLVEERCARCSAVFRCGRDDTQPCDCTGVVLSPTTLARLRGEYTGCLCLKCLRDVAAEATGAGS